MKLCRISLRLVAVLLAAGPSFCRAEPAFHAVLKALTE